VVKLLNWLSKIIFQTLLVTGLTIYFTWTAVHTYVDKLLLQNNVQTGASKVQFSDFLLQLSNDMNILKQTQAQASTQAQAPTQAPAGANNTIVTGGVESRTTIAPHETADSLTAMAQAAAANGAQSGQSSSEKTAAKNNVLMTAAQFTQIKDKITENDKMQIFSLLANKLPDADLQQFSTYLENGVTEAEWENIQAIVQKYLSSAEYKQLLDILAKY